MLIRITKLGQGLHPSETVVAVSTKFGAEEVVVDTRSLHGDDLFVGWPVGQDNDAYLIELPRPTLSGKWRVWVSKQNVLPDSQPERRRA
jgi:hypothetical protein